MPRILVVDDDRLIRTLLTSIFEMHGIECVTASGGDEALDRMREEGFDLVLLDLMMPGMDGFGVLDALAGFPPPHPPIMIATAASPALIEKLPASRVAAVLAKPFDVDELIATAQHVVRRTPSRPQMRIVSIEAGAPAAAALRRRIPFA